MNQKRWKLDSPDMQSGQALYEQLKIRPVYCQMLVKRGIRSFEQAKMFFRPDLSHLHAPRLMKGMKKAVDRIDIAIQNKEKILIYGDYDVDGTTAVATVYSFLRNRAPAEQLGYYIPDRDKEGYGISIEGIDYAKKNNYSLILALDCGVKAITQIDYAGNLNIDVIICDHHLPGEKQPSAFALLNPKQKGCSYPYKELSGCGIAFKLICALAEHWKYSTETAFKYLDLVATSIAADIVPLTGENRVLTHFGLKKINEDPLPAIKALANVSGLKGTILIRDVIFMLAPRINAAGRLGDAKSAVQLFIEKDPEKAAILARELHELNIRRKNLDRHITNEILARISGNEELATRKTTVMYDPEWHKGVIGITASRVMETYYRPTIILTRSNGIVSGSARSIKGFNIYNALKECEPLLERFGGHFFAAGMSLKPMHVEAFTQKFEEVVTASIDPKLLTPEIEIEAEVSFSDLNENFYNMLLQFEPYGPENKQPVFLIKEVRDNGYSKIIRSRHIRLEICHPSCPGRSLAGIGFNLEHKFDLVSSGKPFDLCFSLEKNEFSGKSQLQLRVWDLKASQNGKLSTNRIKKPAVPSENTF